MYNRDGVIAEPLQVFKMANKDSTHCIFFFFSRAVASALQLQTHGHVYKQITVVFYTGVS